MKKQTQILLWALGFSIIFVLLSDVLYLLFNIKGSIFIFLAFLAVMVASLVVLLNAFYHFGEFMKRNNGTEKPVKKAGKNNKNGEKRYYNKPTFGEKMADSITEIIGSWKFIIIQSILLLIWMILNLVAWTNHWDPYPFILLNLALSFQAAYAAPIIMMSQNRSVERDRRKAEDDLATDRRAERGIAEIQKQLNRLENNKIKKILEIIEDK